MTLTLWSAGHFATRIGLVGLLLAAGLASAQPLTLVRKIELPGVHGRIDHMAADAEGGRLFVAALASDSLEVIDLRSGRRTDRIGSPREPQGVLYLANSKRLIVANGRGGVQAFAAAKQPAVATQLALDDTDNLRWDAAAGTVYVGFSSALAELDASSLRVRRRIELAAHPEAFQIEQSGRRIYVNVPNAGHIAVVNRDSGKVEATWVLDDAARNFPMALDEAGHRLFVATRLPALLLVYDTVSGRRVARVPTCGDADDVFFDDARQQLYVVCGEGRVDTVRGDGGQYLTLAQTRTSPGARTGLYAPETSTLFVAAPASNGMPAHVLEYRIP
jgi:DNA-binding beta-propeller fold protein YncE